MRIIIIIGAAGTAGRAIHHLLTGRGHDIITVGRTSGDILCDITDQAQLDDLWHRAGTVDAVICAAGDVPYGDISELGSEGYQAAFANKVLTQINLVRTGLSHVTERGSFTLISDILARDPIRTGTAAAMVNGAIEAFVRAASIEIAPRRINVVSPSVFTESLESYGDFFPGYPSVDVADVAQAFQKSVEGAATGQVIALP